MEDFARNRNGITDLFHRTKSATAEIPIEENIHNERNKAKIFEQNSQQVPQSWLIAFIAISLLLIGAVAVAGFVISTQKEELSRKEVFSLALAVASDFTTGMATISIAPAIYILCQRRDDIHHKNPFVIQFMIYVAFCGLVHLLAVGYLHSTVSSFIVTAKFLCALFSVTTVGSLYLLMDVFVKMPSKHSYSKLKNEVYDMKRKFQLLDSSPLCNKLRFADSEEDCCCIMIQELAKAIPCDILGSYHCGISGGDSLNDRDSAEVGNSVLTVASSNPRFSLPQTLSLQLLETRDEITIFRKTDSRLLGSLLSVDSLYDPEGSIVSIPTTLENELLGLPFNFFILISSYNSMDNVRVDFILCFVNPLRLDAERLILLRQCATLSQFALSSLFQINFLSTRTKQIEEDSEMLLDEKQRVQKLLEEKSKFLSSITSEIRNGLVNVQNSLILVSTEDGSNEYGTKIFEDTNSLVTFVNDIVDYVRPINEFLEPPQDIWEFNAEIQNIWKNIRDNVAPQFAGQAHMASIPSDIPRFVIGDRNVFIRAMLTLITFSLELVGKGSVLLSVKTLSFNSEHKFFVSNSGGQKVRCVGNAMLQLDIVGSGKGLGSQEIEKIFDPLYRTGSSHSGLRLAIAKQEITRAGGKIRVDSSVSMGSTFSVVFPFIVADVKPDTRSMVLSPVGNGNSPNVTNFSTSSKGSHKPKDKTTKKEENGQTQERKPITVKEKGSDLHILIAEDNLLNQKVLVRLLAKLGQKDVTLVTQGDLAVTAVRESDIPFDLIFMDLHMPVMGGIEACKLIRELDSVHYPQIIACTANAQNDVKAQFSRLGAYAFIPKPINFKKLSAALEDYFSL